MIQPTAPLTQRQLALLQTRKRLERRLQAPTSRDYGVATQMDRLDNELDQLERAKRPEVMP